MSLSVRISVSYLCRETTLPNQCCALKAHQSLLSHTVISCRCVFHSVGLHRLHLLSTLRSLQNKAGKSAVPVKAGKSPWGMTEEQKWRRGGEGERESEATNEEERLAGKEGTGGGIKLALGHLMTNNGTAPHHCRKAAREQKRGGTMRNDCIGSYVSSTGLTESHNIVLWKYSHIWVLENHTAHESEGTTNIYSILCRPPDAFDLWQH